MSQLGKHDHVEPFNAVPTPIAACGWCGHKTDHATALDGERRVPNPGDCSLCLLCAEVSLFTDDGTLRQPTIEEAAEIYADPDIKRARATLRASLNHMGIVDPRTP